MANPRLTDDEDDWDEEEVVFELEDGFVADGEESMLADLLLELTINTTRLSLLLEEAEAGEFRAAAKRLQRFRESVAALPTSALPTRKLGFQVDKATEEKKAPKKGLRRKKA